METGLDQAVHFRRELLTDENIRAGMTPEEAQRAALAASRNTILSVILRETLVLALAGLAVGLPCVLAASHLVGHMLFNVSPNDPATLAVGHFLSPL